MWKPPGLRKVKDFFPVVSAFVVLVFVSVPCCYSGCYSENTSNGSPDGQVGQESQVQTQIEKRFRDELPDFTKVFRKASPSVVNVEASFDLPVVGDSMSGRNDRLVSRSLGSGFVFEDGYIVTCSTVVHGAGSIKVSFSKGPVVDATLTASDDVSDLAVLKVKKHFAHALAIAPRDSIHQGDWVASLGYPYGLSRSLSVGVVSSIRTKQELESLAGLIVSDAAVNPGCNGGPLLNTKGEVIGINIVTHTGDESFGLALPIHDVWPLIQTLRQGKSPAHAWLGISAQYIDESLADAFGIQGLHGALISRVWPASPAAKAGLRRGDVVTRFGGHPVDDPLALVEAVRKARLGKRVYIELIRDSKNKKLSIVPVASNR